MVDKVMIRYIRHGTRLHSSSGWDVKGKTRVLILASSIVAPVSPIWLLNPYLLKWKGRKRCKKVGF